MIPVKLKLSNFTSYASEVPALDFTNFHLAAISGQNGAGKSSLLDAITWCLWGTSRLGDSSDPLVRLGQKEMWVQFAFNLDNHIFTVKRARLLKGGGSTSLEFLTNNHNLTEGTIKATQQKIIDTLHLTYETFTNSAFLRQGHADEFTTKGPADRKRILADILGLGHYDLLEEKAKEKSKEIDTKLKLFEYQLLEIEAELSLKEDREKNLTDAEEEAKAAEKELAETERQIREIELEKQAALSKYQALQEKQARLKTAEKELEDLKIQISLKEQAKKEYQEILDQKEEIEKNYQKLQQLHEEKKTLDTKRSELIKVKDELTVIQKTLMERREKRDKEVTKLEVEIKELQTQNQQKELQNDQLKARKDICPTCGQELGKEKNKEIISSNLSFIKNNDLKIKELEGKRDKYVNFSFPEQEQVEEKEKLVQKLEKETDGYFEISNQINQLSKYENLYLKLQQADTAVKAHQEAILDLEKVYQNRAKQLEEEGKDLQMLKSYEENLQEQELKLRGKESFKKELAEKVASLRGKAGEAKQLRDRTLQLEDIFAKKSEEKKKLQKEKEAFDELSLAFGKKGIQAMIIETAIPEIEDESNSLLNKLTSGRMRVRFETQRETKTKIAGEHGIVETLDIIISDEMGARPYETFSGGEAFRVNLAIRLALSKLLTHRAGAKLQFLVIDEGFGTQDAEGRARVIEALNTIKDDFEKILIITHLEELKEEFPVRIEVSKTPTGSTFEVVGV